MTTTKLMLARRQIEYASAARNTLRLHEDVDDVVVLIDSVAWADIGGGANIGTVKALQMDPMVSHARTQMGNAHTSDTYRLSPYPGSLVIKEVPVRCTGPGETSSLRDR